MADNPGHPSRPRVITILCAVALPFFALASYRYITDIIPMIRAEFGSVLAGYSVVGMPLTVMSLLGYWRMAKWGVVLYCVLFIVGNALALTNDVPISVRSVFVPLIVLGIGFRYFRQMHSGFWTGPALVPAVPNVRIDEGGIEPSTSVVDDPTPPSDRTN